MNEIQNTPALRVLARRHLKNASEIVRGSQRLIIVAAALFGLAAFTLPAGAQNTTTNMTIKPFRVRVELPSGFAGTFYLTNCTLRVPTNTATGVDGTGTNWSGIPTVNVSISSIPGCTASLVATDGVTPVSIIQPHANTNQASFATNLMAVLVFDGTEAGGTTNLNILATGGGYVDDSFLLGLQIAMIWNHSGNALVVGPGSFSDGAQWSGTGAPGLNDEVVFTDIGTQTNSLTFGVGVTNFLTNCVISSSTAISSLRFCQTNGTTTNNQNIYINPGVTLGIGGRDGFSLLRDYTYWSGGLMKVAFYGTNGTLIQTNESSDFSILSDAQENSVLDMSGLGSLQLDVNQLHLSDYAGYPNYDDLVYSNGYTSTTAGAGKPQRFYQTWDMANTNIIKAVFVDPNNYTNSLTRDYALVLGRNEASGGGSGKDVEMFMGYSNVFNLDSMCVAGSFCLGADLHFLHPGSYAIFRNSDGVGRMSIFATDDAGGGGTNLWGTGLGDNTKCGGNGTGVDFTTGTVDMLVDRFYLSMDRSNVTANGKGVSQCSGFAFSAGTIDANTAILGYQSQGDQTNQSYCYANMTVSNTAVFKVNNDLALGYSTATPGGVNAEQNGYGKLNIGPLGTVYANNISVGGVTKASAGNNIALTGGASLVVSNSIGDDSGGDLGLLSFGGNCSLTLFIDGSKPAIPLVWLTNLTATGIGNRLVIGGVTNVATFPADFPLIEGVGPSVSPTVFDAGVTLPPGMFGTLYLSSSNTINIHILNRTPHHLLWRGVGSGGTGTWDYTTANWLDQDTGLTTNYNNPDYAAFDDAPGYATNISIAGGSTAFTPATMSMTNNNLYYTFTDGGNLIAGGPQLNKYGTGTIEIDANTTISLNLNQGSLAGGTSPGAIDSVNVAAGATMIYSGAVGGSLICAGTATSSGSIAGTLTVSPGGVVTNSGSLANPFAVKTNGLFYNSGSLNNIGAGSAGSPQVSAGGILINAGTIGQIAGGNILYVSGTFEDLSTAGMTLQSVSVGPGGTFIPGSESTTGITAINSDGTGNFPGAALLAQGSTTILMVDPTVPTNAVLASGHISFGGSASARTQNGCTLVISNTTATPFAAGQIFPLFTLDNNGSVGGNIINTGSSTNTYPVLIPATPGPGLVWDLRNLWVPSGSGQNGLIGIVSALGGPTLTNGGITVYGGTNIVAQFSWDPSNEGVSLEQKVVPLTGGVNSTNPWTRVAGSWTNTSEIITNTSFTNNVFFRLSFP